MKNLASTALPPNVVADIGNQMGTIKAEINALQAAEPPKDYSFEIIESWLSTIKNAPDEKAVRLLIERIDIKTKTEFNMTSTLNSVVGKNGYIDKLLYNQSHLYFLEKL